MDKLLGTITKSGDYGEKRKTQFNKNKQEASTLRTTIMSEGGELLVLEESEMLRIRKLTEGECMRLMGFEEKDTEACRKANLSKANIFHQSGDSIVTTVLVGIFGELLGSDYERAIAEYADGLHGEVCHEDL